MSENLTPPDVAEERRIDAIDFWLGAGILSLRIADEVRFHEAVELAERLKETPDGFPPREDFNEFISKNVGIGSTMADGEKRKLFEDEAQSLAEKAYRVMKPGESWNDKSDKEPYEFYDLKNDRDEVLIQLENAGERKMSAAQVDTFFNTPGNEITDSDLEKVVNFLSMNDRQYDGLNRTREKLGETFNRAKYRAGAGYKRQVDAINEYLDARQREIIAAHEGRQFIATTPIEQLYSAKLTGTFDAEDYGLPPEFTEGTTEEVNLRLRAIFSSEDPQARLISTFLLMKAFRQADGLVDSGYIKPYIEQTEKLNRDLREHNQPVEIEGDALWGLYFNECLGMLALGCDDDSNLWLENIKKVFGANETEDRLTKNQLKEFFGSPQFELARQIWDDLLNNPYTIYQLKHYKNLSLTPDGTIVARDFDPIAKLGTDPADFIKNLVVPALRAGRTIKTRTVRKVIQNGVPSLMLEDVEIKPNTYNDFGLPPPEGVSPNAPLKGFSEENAMLALNTFEGLGSRFIWGSVSLKMNNGIPWFNTDREGNLVLEDEYLCWGKSNPNRSITRFDGFIRGVKKHSPIEPTDLPSGMESSRNATQSIIEFNRDLLLFEPLAAEIVLAAYGFQPISISGKNFREADVALQTGLLKAKLGREGVGTLIYPPIPKKDAIPVKNGNRNFSVSPSRVILEELTPYDPVQWAKKSGKMNTVWGGFWEIITKKTPGTFQEGAGGLRRVVQDESRNTADLPLSLLQTEIAVARAWGLLGWLMSISSVPFNPNNPRDGKNVTNAFRDAQNQSHIFLGDYEGLTDGEVVDLEGKLVRVQSKAAENAKSQGGLKQEKTPNLVQGAFGLVSTIVSLK